MNTSQKGNVATSRVLAALVALGKDVAIPFGDNQRYDLVIDDGDRLLRVQCKMGRLYKGCVVFMVSTQRRKTKETPSSRDSYRGQVDLFGVYCPQSDTTYLVPIEDVTETAACLRVEPPRNKQTKGIRWAKDYQLGVVAQLGARFNGIEEVEGSNPSGSTKI